MCAAVCRAPVATSTPTASLPYKFAQKRVQTLTQDLPAVLTFDPASPGPSHALALRFTQTRQRANAIHQGTGARTNDLHAGGCPLHHLRKFTRDVADDRKAGGEIVE